MGSLKTFQQNQFSKGSGNNKPLGFVEKTNAATTNRAIKAFTPSAAACSEMRNQKNDGHQGESFFNFNSSPTAISHSGNYSQSVIMTPAHHAQGSVSLKNGRGAMGFFHSSTNAATKVQVHMRPG